MASSKKSKVIIVITYEGSPWLEDCLKSLEGVKYPIDVCLGGSTFDPMGFYRAKEKGYDEFILLHDTCVIKDTKLIDIMFEKEGHVSLSPGFLMCLGKYVTKDLHELPPQPMTKRQAIEFEGQYCSALRGECLFTELLDSDKFEEKNGRNNMVLENDYIRKYKGFWSIEQVVEVYEKGNSS